MVREAALLLASLGALIALEGCTPPEGAVTPATIRRIEARLPLLEGGKPPSSYTRLYALGRAENELPPTYPSLREPHGRLLIGLWLAEDVARRVGGERRGIHIIPRRRLPVIYDGGCDVVRFFYDLDRRRLLLFSCSGPW